MGAHVTSGWFAIYGDDVMWKWLFVLLLLVNALVFFWYAQEQSQQRAQQAPATINRDASSVPEFRLVDPDHMNQKQQQTD